MTHDRRRLRRRIGWALPTAGVVAVLAIAASASATCSACVKRNGLWSAYTTHAGCPEGKPIDPINMLWQGNSSVTPGNIARKFSAIGYSWNDYDYPGADRQYVIRYPGHYCQIDQAQRADDCPACSRDHIRFFPSWNGGYLVVGDAHHDRDSVDPGCWHFPIPGGHIATDFNGPRNRMAARWSQKIHRGIYWHKWRNTAGMVQCDDGYPFESPTVTHSDGWVAFLNG